MCLPYSYNKFRPEIENDLIVGNLGGSDNVAVGGRRLLKVGVLGVRQSESCFD